MNALEFTTRIEEGVIHLPQEYNEYQNSYVRIILLVEDSAPLTLSKKEKLRETFRKMRNQKMFAGIENPLEWQKKQIDEWD
jgi:hypothetical protein